MFALVASVLVAAHSLGCSLEPTNMDQDTYGDDGLNTITVPASSAWAEEERAPHGATQRVQKLAYQWRLRDAPDAIVQGLSSDYITLHFSHSIKVHSVYGATIVSDSESFECEEQAECDRSSLIELQISDSIITLHGARMRPLTDGEDATKLFQPAVTCKTAAEYALAQRRPAEPSVDPPQPSTDPPPLGAVQHVLGHHDQGTEHNWASASGIDHPSTLSLHHSATSESDEARATHIAGMLPAVDTRGSMPAHNTGGGATPTLLSTQAAAGMSYGASISRSSPGNGIGTAQALLTLIFLTGLAGGGSYALTSGACQRALARTRMSQVPTQELNDVEQGASRNA